MAHWYQQLHRYAQAFALVGDWTAVFLGGNLKRKQLLSGRMADILSELYLLSATLKRFEDDGLFEEDRAVVTAVARDRVKAIETGFAEVFDNFPNVVMRNLMRFLVLPFGRRARGSSDRENYRLGRAILNPGALRDRMTRGLYISYDPEDPTGLMEDALIKVSEAAEAEAKFVRAVKTGVVRRRLDRDAISDAVQAGVLSKEEAIMLRAADEATDRAIKVDDFPPDAFSRLEKSTKSSPSGLHQAAE
jgi:acyl-CoA dehydrogenase